jgi:molybdopterin molybdotransferase
MIEVDQALSLVLQHARALTPALVPIVGDALGLVLAEDVVSRVDCPPFDKALMDGYAVIAADLNDDSVELRVLEQLTAGDVPRHRVERGCAARIMTGAVMPEGADAVVVLERTASVDPGSPQRVRITGGATAVGKHVLRRARLMQRGEVALRRGHRLSAVEIGLLAEIQVPQVRVYPRPQVSILATGSELAPAGQAAGLGQIANSNGPMLCGLVTQAGGCPHDLGIGRDDPAELRRLMASGLEADVLVMSGGVSTGDHDFVPRVLRELGVEPVLHGVRLKPGKPLWFGVAKRGDRQKLVFGLPGNPVSCLVCFELFVRPALGALGGDPNRGLRRATYRLAKPFEHRGDRPTYYPARLRDQGGEVRVEPLAWQGSADLRALAQADALALFAAGSRHYDAGDLVTVLLLERP